MKTIELTRLSPENYDKIMDLKEACNYINLFYPLEVSEFIEAYDNWADHIFLVEICDELKIPLIIVRETTRKGIIIHGYIRKELMVVS